MKHMFVVAAGSLVGVLRPTLNLVVLSVALVAGTLALTACGGPAGNNTPAGGAYGDADVAFATGMIVHHAQAVRMADMALAQASSSEVKELAAAIKAAQGPDIERMSGYLTSWGMPVPETMGHTMEMTGGSMDSGMGGMMSEQDMATLSKTSGPAFDRAWLTGMTTHHQGAVTMAQAELKAGRNADAMQVARNIMSSQTAEITRMEGMLTSLPQ